ncbi:EMC3/TMCO1 family protein [Candidatus Parvarchaeota archaeon]|nr:EMC3/TMCO1 family protein [Candidatus Parvarchaeota archaeon]
MLVDTIIIILVSLAVGISGQLAYMFIVDHELVRNSKIKIKQIQAQLKQIKPNDPQFKPVYSELMAENSKIMKQSMKPTFITIIPFLIVFLVMSSYFSYSPIGLGVPIHTTVAGYATGSLSSLSDCAVFQTAPGKNSTNINLTESKLPVSFSTFINSKTCSLSFTSNKITNSTNVSGVIGAVSPKKYSLNGISVELFPPTFVVAMLPFSIPFIGNQLTWFWAYFIISLVSGLVVNRILAHFKLIA